MALIGEMQYLTIGGNTYSLPVGGGGTVTSVAVSNATNGGLSVSGSPISSSGIITIGHSNVLASAQTTSGVYPIKIDKNGHISEYGSAVTIPSITLNGSSFTSPSFYAPTDAGTNNYVLKSNGSGAPSWTSAVLTDENVKSTAVTTATTYYLVGSTSSTTTTGELSKHASAYIDVSANSDTGGLSTLTLGNNIADGTAGSKEGRIVLYGLGTAKASIYPSNEMSSNSAFFLPKTGGSLALTSDIPTVPTKVSDLTNDSGFVTTDENVKISGSSTEGNYQFTFSNSGSYPITSSLYILSGCNFTIGASANILKLGTSSKPGQIAFPNGAYTTTLTTESVTNSNKTITLPNKTGTVALTSDIPTTHSIPSGGTTGQALAKNSATDYDVSWVDVTTTAAQIIRWTEST